MVASSENLDACDIWVAGIANLQVIPEVGMVAIILIFAQLAFLLLCFSGEHWSKKIETTLAPGVWGKWGSWGDCSKTCAIGVRRRTRTCSYTGHHKALKCNGNMGQITNCDTKLTCPVHGEWSPWIAWKCTVTCGGGDGIQRRSCDKPKPMFGGNACNGSAEEKGKCNMQKCPDQVYTLSPETAQAVKNSIDNEHHNFEKKQDETVTIPCSRKAVTKIYEEYPKTSLMWTKNGQILKYDHERMGITPSELVIRKLKSFDSGVYLCSVQYAPQVVKPVSVSALAITSASPDIQIPAEESVNLLCHSTQLAKIYKNATLRWFLNGKEYKKFGSASPVENNVLEIDEVKKNMSGKWSCRIRDPITSKEWTTNVIVVKVLPALPKFLKFLSNRNVLLTIGILLFVLIMLFGTIFGYFIMKTREEFMAEYEKWNQIVRWEEIKAGGVPEWAQLNSEEISDSRETETDDEI